MQDATPYQASIDLEYLNMVVHESLRLYPPFPQYFSFPISYLLCACLSHQLQSTVLQSLTNLRENVPKITATRELSSLQELLLLYRASLCKRTRIIGKILNNLTRLGILT